jgi:hypothetical protein
MDLDAKDGLCEDDVEELAQLFHNVYEELAPSFGYETRQETKIFDKNSNNGKLMIATIKKIKETLFTEEQVRFIICKSFLLGVDRGEYSKDFEDRMIESLKQSKI